ncbi:MAG: FAD-dependent oxidoreductase, partial [Planctomycetota bacterium]
KAGGFAPIFEGMADPLRERIRLSTPVTDLVRSGSGWRVNGEEFDRVVSTLSLTDLPDLVEGMPADVAEAMRTLEYNGLVCFLLALDRPEHPDLSWIYLPHPAQGPANRITYMSNYSAGNAPEGKTSFLCEMTVPGGAGFPPANLEQEVIAGMEHAGLLKRDEILFADRHDTRQAYVVFDHDYHARRKVALGWLEENGLTPLGRFGRFEYDNSDQCVIKARALATRLAAEATAG